MDHLSSNSSEFSSPNLTFTSVNTNLNLTDGDGDSELPQEVLRYLCESTDAVLNLTTVEFFANVSMNETTWFELDMSSAFRIAFIGILFVISVVGNTIVVLVVFWSPNLKSSLNFYLVNLAIADLLITCICIWNHLVKNIFYNYPLGPVMCKIGSFVQASCLLGSVLTLSTLSVERVYAVLCPLKARQSHLPPSITLTAVWLVSLLAAAPLCALSEYREYQFPNFRERRCTYYHSPGTFRRSDGRCVRDTHTFIYFYHVLVTVLMFFLPLFVMACSYLLIVHKLWLLESLGESPEQATSAHLSAKKKVVRLSCSILACFVLCWAPLQTTILYAITAKPQALSSHEFESTIFWVYILAYSNSAINPLIYAWFSKIFRQEFRTMISPRQLRFNNSVIRRSHSRHDPPTRSLALREMYSYPGSYKDARLCSSYCGNTTVMVRYGTVGAYGRADSCYSAGSALNTIGNKNFYSPSDNGSSYADGSNVDTSRCCVMTTSVISTPVTLKSPTPLDNPPGHLTEDMSYAATRLGEGETAEVAMSHLSSTQKMIRCSDVSIDSQVKNNHTIKIKLPIIKNPLIKCEHKGDCCGLTEAECMKKCECISPNSEASFSDLFSALAADPASVVLSIPSHVCSLDSSPASSLDLSHVCSVNSSPTICMTDRKSDNPCHLSPILVAEPISPLETCSCDSKVQLSLSNLSSDKENCTNCSGTESIEDLGLNCQRVLYH